MAPTSNTSTVKINFGSPQAVDDTFIFSEDAATAFSLAVQQNDAGGNGKTLFSIVGAAESALSAADISDLPGSDVGLGDEASSLGAHGNRVWDLS